MNNKHNKMKIGVPTETKVFESRVGLVPDACRMLVNAGHELFIQASAGSASGYPDEQYIVAGANIVENAAALYQAADLIVKVKEPVSSDLAHLEARHIVFSYLHLAAEPELTRQLLDIGLTAIAFETVIEPNGQLPLLKPMSQIAGVISMQRAMLALHSPEGGMGMLLGGLAGAPKAKVVVLGAGNAGASAALYAAANGAAVTVFDKKLDVLDVLRHQQPFIDTLYPYDDNLHEAVINADVLIGAVLVPGLKAPVLVSDQQVQAMRDGSVIADIAVDQGGCIATTKASSYEQPLYKKHGVQHFTVTNMPGAVGRTASQALSAAVLPYVLRLAEPDGLTEPVLQQAINVADGEIRFSGITI